MCKLLSQLTDFAYRRGGSANRYNTAMKTMEEADGAVEVTDPIEEANASMEFEEEEEPESPELNVGRIFLGISFD